MPTYENIKKLGKNDMQLFHRIYLLLGVWCKRGGKNRIRVTEVRNYNETCTSSRILNMQSNI